MNTIFKQTIQLIKTNKVMSTISIAGTALSITLIMLLVLIYQIQTANIAPEVNRDRTLYAENLFYTFNIGERSWGWAMSPRVIKDVFYSLKSAQACATGSLKNSYLSSTDEQRRMKGYFRPTDHLYFKLYKYNFLAGGPFTKEEFESGIKKIVITEEVARNCFGGVKEAMGQTLLINFNPFEVCGVVENVSSLLKNSYSDIWLPYTTIKTRPMEGAEDTMGDFFAIILMNSPDDYEKVMAEIDENFKRFNAGLTQGKIILQTPVRSHLLWAMGGLLNTKDMGRVVISILLILGILLLVPALNLSSFTVSRMRNRISEIGIRKAYGAVRTDILNQVIVENMILTLIGGAVGVINGYLMVRATTEMLLPGDFRDLSAHSFFSNEMLFRPVVILYAILFCLLLNLMSALIPAWRVSNITIIKAIRN